MLHQHDRVTARMAVRQLDNLNTDGGVVKEDSVGKGDGQSLNHIGSGVFCRALELSLHVDPCGQGAINTITRAGSLFRAAWTTCNTTSASLPLTAWPACT